jgi:hypothetical protein
MRRLELHGHMPVIAIFFEATGTVSTLCFAVGIARHLCKIHTGALRLLKKPRISILLLFGTLGAHSEAISLDIRSIRQPGPVLPTLSQTPRTTPFFAP